MTAATDISDIVDAPKAPAKGAAKPSLKKGERIVTIHPGAEADGMSPVKLGLGGDITLVPRNVPCPLSLELIEVLRNCVYTEWREVDGHFVQHDRQRFSFSITD